jgi:hypothetical protein
MYTNGVLVKAWSGFITFSVIKPIVSSGWITRLILTLSEPACFDKEGATLIECYRYVLVLLYCKEHVIDI